MHAAGLLLAGACSGVIGALLGLGGGIFLIPALVLIFGVPMHSAVAAGLVAVIATSSAGGSRNAKKGVANVR
ncbi:MAG: TSUP family transporter, partial [Elusimicrobiota bacterium]